MAEGRDNWDKVRVVAQVAASLLIPIVLGIVGWRVDKTIEDQRTRAAYVEVAVGVLRAPPSPETRQLREWAATVLNEYAPIKLTRAATSELESQPLPSAAADSGYYAPGYIEPGIVEGVASDEVPQPR